MVVLGIVLAILPLLLSAAPIEDPGRGFIIPLTPRCSSQVFSRTCWDGVNSYLSHGLSKRKPKTGIASLNSENDVTWQAKVNLGSGFFPKVFHLAVDTGSSDLLVAGTKAMKSQGKVIYKPKRTQTQIPKFRVRYSGGSTAAGGVFKDRVTIGGLTATDQAIAVADTLTGQFLSQSFTADGCLGLGRPGLSKTEEPPFLQTLEAQGQIKDVMFGILMRVGEGCYSELSLGFANNNMYKEDTLSFAPVISDVQWKLQMKISVGGQQLPFSRGAIIDSGTTLIIGDPDSVKMLYAQIPRAEEMARRPGYYYVPCEANPSVSMTFGEGSSRSFEIKPIHFARRVEPGSNICYGGIVASDAALADGWLVGGTFLNGVYAIFKEKGQVSGQSGAPLSSTVQYPPLSSDSYTLSSSDSYSPPDLATIAGPVIGFAEVADKMVCRG